MNRSRDQSTEVAEAAHLAGDGAAGLRLPLPDAFDEFVAAEIEAVFALRRELALHHHLRGDAGVIGARLPQRVKAAHAMPARERIHERVLEGVAHVQRAGDVRRRQHDAIGRAFTGGRECSGSFPTFVDPALDVARGVGLVHEGPGLYRKWGHSPFAS